MISRYSPPWWRFMHERNCCRFEGISGKGAKFPYSAELQKLVGDMVGPGERVLSSMPSFFPPFQPRRRVPISCRKQRFMPLKTLPLAVLGKAAGSFSISSSGFGGSVLSGGNNAVEQNLLQLSDFQIRPCVLIRLGMPDALYSSPFLSHGAHIVYRACLR